MQQPCLAAGWLRKQGQGEGREQEPAAPSTRVSLGVLLPPGHACGEASPALDELFGQHQRALSSSKRKEPLPGLATPWWIAGPGDAIGTALGVVRSGECPGGSPGPGLWDDRWHILPLFVVGGGLGRR